MTDHQTLLCRYHYDPLDRLSGAAALNEVDTQLFYRKNLLVTQIQGALHASLLRAADGLLAQQQGTAAGFDSALLATDLQHSVLQGLTPGRGQALVYTAYGYHRPCSGPPHLPGFTGEHRDPVTEHYLLGNGYRAFNPVLMRFNSPDSLSPFAEGGLNAYAYCQGDPVNYQDPTGHIISAGYRSAVKIMVDAFDPQTSRRLPVAVVAPMRRAPVIPVPDATPSTAVATVVQASPEVAPYSAQAFRAGTHFNRVTINSLPMRRQEYPVSSLQAFHIYDPDLYRSFTPADVRSHLANNQAAINTLMANTQRTPGVLEYMLEHMKRLYRSGDLSGLSVEERAARLTTIEQQIANLRRA